MSGLGDEPQPPVLLWGTIKIAALLICISTGAATWLAQSGDGPSKFDRLARLEVRKMADPETTGSIGHAARSTRLDPCVLSR